MGSCSTLFQARQVGNLSHGWMARPAGAEGVRCLLQLTFRRPRFAHDGTVLVAEDEDGKPLGAGLLAAAY